MRKFAAWSERAVDFAARLAKYQSPRLRAVAIAPPPSVEEKPRRFTLKVFTGGRALEPPIEPVPEPPRDPRYPKPPRFGWTILARPSPSCADDDDRSCLSPASPQQGGKKRINRPPPQPTLPAVRHAILELLARQTQRYPHCSKWISNKHRHG
jgi:hypothetical protein